MRQLLIPLIVLPLIACQATATRKTREPTSAELAAVKQEWIDKSCNAGESWDEFEACLVVATQQLPPLDSSKREHFGERYDPKQWLACMRRASDSGKRGDGACEKFRLQRKVNPEYWPYPNVPPVKWPDAPKEQVYRSGMSSQEYFDALCKAEAGEFIYKAVENVEGLYQIRPRAKEDGNARQEDRYVLEDPYGYAMGNIEKPENEFVQPPFGPYTFFEVPEVNLEYGTTPRAGRYFRGKSNGKTYGYMKYNPSSDTWRGVDVPYVVEYMPSVKPSAFYGVTWRGIERAHDRELGIAGGEWIVLDLQTNEILGVRRNFARSGNMQNGTGIWWLTSQSCPQLTKEEGRRRVKRDNIDFIKSVTHPVVNSNQ